MIQGPTYPIINVVVSRWAVAHERSRMIAVLYTGKARQAMRIFRFIRVMSNILFMLGQIFCC
jgi:hypothetical protein